MTRDTFPLTAIERRFWWVHQLHPAAPVANIGRVVTLRGALDVDAVVAAYRIVADHPTLRLRVGERDGEPVGTFGAPGALEVVDADPVDVGAAIQRVVRAPFDLEGGPLFRARLLRHDDEHHTLVMGAHHLILDGWALSCALPRALCAAIARDPLPVPSTTAWLASRAAEPAEPPAVRDADRQWWKQALAGATPMTLPTVHPPPARASGIAHDDEVAIPPALLARVRAFAQVHQTRLSNVFLAAFAVELSRACGSGDLLLGTTRASRSVDAADPTALACCVRTKALQVCLPEEATFIDAMAAARTATKTSLTHGAIDAEDLVSDGAPAIGAIYNFIPFSDFDGAIDGVSITAGRIIAGGTGFPIALTVEEGSSLPRLVVEVAADRFDASMATGLAARVLQHLETGIAEPARPVSRFPRLLSADTLAIAASQGPSVARTPVVGGHLGRAVAADLAAAPDTPALVAIADHRARLPSTPVGASPVEGVGDDVVTTRGALLRDALRIAASLRAEGLGPGDFVGVCCRTPTASVTAIFGVLFAGAAYVPIDPHAPPQRRAAIVTQAGLSVVLGDADVDARRAAGSRPDDRPDDRPTPWAAAVDAIPGSGRDPAYAIFTSGSTGTPKGVVISHDAVMAQLQAREGAGFPRVERALLLAPFFFDGSIETLFWSFTTGGVLHLLDDDSRRDPVAIRQTLSRRRIAYTSAVPALWGAMLDAADVREEPLDALGFVIVGGEKLTPQLIDTHNRHTRAWLVNEYGPTESTVFSTYWSAPLAGAPAPTRVPIGVSAPHVRCYVVDDGLQPVPMLEAGELVVTGLGLADGYVNEPALTDAAFVSMTLPVPELRPDLQRGEQRGEQPLGPADLEVHPRLSWSTTRAYRTGDICRLWPDGTFEWLARKDDQVKLRGVRVEPGEVEAALQAEGFREVAVVVQEHHLLAYVVVDDAGGPSTTSDSADLRAAPLGDDVIADLVERLRRRLPEAMIPARFVAMRALPHTANDKIDRKRLPREAVVEVIVPPATPTEEVIAGVWRSVLGVHQVSVTQSFFALGGHSLKAASVVRGIKDVCGVDIPLSRLMVARTVRGLAQVVDDARRAPSTSSGPEPLLLPLRDRGDDGAHRHDIPVVFLPGVGGHVFTFAPLASRMKRGRCLGLRTWGSEPGEAPLRHVAELAAHNNRALDEAGLGDDVVLAGYSFGGMVAFEMAWQRIQQGRRPAHLVIFDTMAPGYPRKLPLLQRTRLHARDFVRADWAGRRRYLRDRVDSLKEKWAFRMEKAEAFTDAFALDEHALAAFSPEKRRQLEQLAGISTLAFNDYWPRSSIAVPTLLFAAAVPFSWAATDMSDPWLGWRTWLNHPLQRVELRGAHLELFQEGNLDTAAAALDALVAKVPARQR